VQGQSGLEPYYAYDAENKMKSVGGGSEGGGTTLKLLYLALQNIAWKWMMPIKEWKAALNRFAIIFEDRMPAL
jgi:pantothenate kinase